MKKKIIIIAISIIGLVTLISLILILSNDKKIKTYNVSFETNGGTEINAQVVNEGEKVVKPTDPEKEGYIFVQWIYEGKTYDFSSVVKSDLVLKAEWTEKVENIETFVVIFNSDGGTTIPNQIIEKGNKVTIPTNPTKEGYNFVEWQYNGVKYDFEKIVENNFELKAQWEKNKESSNNTTKPNKNNNKKPVSSGTNNNSSINNSATQPSKNEIKLSTPTITKGGYGADGEGTVGMELKLNSTEGITGVEVYSATTENGTYTLKETVKKENLTNQAVNVFAQKGQRLYFKVRTYVKNSAGTFYSGYSNIMELDNSN